MTKQDLQEYYWLQKKIKQLEDKLFELDTAATKMTKELTFDSSTPQFNDKLASLVAEITEVKQEISDQLKRSHQLLKDILSAIDRLPAREKYLIHARYLDMRTWEDIAVDMGYSWKQTHNIHALALKLLA